MKIAIDAMGGDFAPGEVVKGAVMGANQYGVGIILVGVEDRIKAELAKYDTAGLDIGIVHTDEYLLEGEPPAYVMRTKRNASIMLATKIVKDGKAQAVVGMGPTGGVFASALQVFGPLEGLVRPVVGGQFFGLAPNTFVLDLGGTPDARPDQLLDYGIIGTVCARLWMNIPNPTVALLSNGVEEGKGNQAVKEAYQLFKQSGLNFIGNIEGNDLALGKANVVVCDAFAGNCVVKFCEGMGATTAEWLRQTLKDKMSETAIEELVSDYLKVTIRADTTGGGPLLGLNGIAFKGHGRSKAPEVAMTIGSAKRAIETDMIGILKAELSAIRSKVNIDFSKT